MDGAVPWGRTRTFEMGATCVEVKTSTGGHLGPSWRSPANGSLRSPMMWF